MTNNELIEELLYEAHEKGMGEELLKLAHTYVTEHKMRKSLAYQKAYDDLQIFYY
jgi:hypothetical protein